MTIFAPRDRPCLHRPEGAWALDAHDSRASSWREMQMSTPGLVGPAMQDPAVLDPAVLIPQPDLAAAVAAAAPSTGLAPVALSVVLPDVAGPAGAIPAPLDLPPAMLPAVAPRAPEVETGAIPAEPTRFPHLDDLLGRRHRRLVRAWAGAALIAAATSAALLAL
jgi:hypothetical protein